jgi:hypothetical protein
MQSYLLLMQVVHIFTSALWFRPYGLFEFIITFFLNFMNQLYLVRFLGRVISPLQGLYLHRTTLDKNTKTNIHASSGIRTYDPSNQAAKTYALVRAATWTGHI